MTHPYGGLFLKDKFIAGSTLSSFIISKGIPTTKISALKCGQLGVGLGVSCDFVASRNPRFLLGCGSKAVPAESPIQVSRRLQ